MYDEETNWEYADEDGQPLSETATQLIKMMEELGASSKLINLMYSGLPEEKMPRAMQMMEEHYKKYGQVTEQDMLVALLILTEPTPHK